MNEEQLEILGKYLMNFKTLLGEQVELLQLIENNTVGTEVTEASTAGRSHRQRYVLHIGNCRISRISTS